MSYFAAAVARGPQGWAATTFDLAGVADLEEVADRLRDVAPEAGATVLFVETDDEYLAVVRLDPDGDPRLFASDGAFADESRLGAMLLADLDDGSAPVDLEDLDDELAAADTMEAGEPVGEAALLADLGVPGARLVELCTKEGLLPSDVTAEVCQALGCGEEVEELREA